MPAGRKIVNTQHTRTRKHTCWLTRSNSIYHDPATTRCPPKIENHHSRRAATLQTSISCTLPNRAYSLTETDGQMYQMYPQSKIHPRKFECTTQTQARPKQDPTQIPTKMQPRPQKPYVQARHACSNLRPLDRRTETGLDLTRICHRRRQDQIRKTTTNQTEKDERD